jgi:hypothetical protein
MDDAHPPTALPDDPAQLKRLIAARDQLLAAHQATIATLTQQRDAFHLEKLRLEVRLAQALKQAYGPRTDRLSDPGQFLLDFAQPTRSVAARSVAEDRGGHPCADPRAAKLNPAPQRPTAPRRSPRAVRPPEVRFIQRTPR